MLTSASSSTSASASTFPPDEILRLFGDRNSLMEEFNRPAVLFAALIGDGRATETVWVLTGEGGAVTSVLVLEVWMVFEVPAPPAALLWFEKLSTWCPVMFVPWNVAPPITDGCWFAVFWLEISPGRGGKVRGVSNKVPRLWISIVLIAALLSAPISVSVDCSWVLPSFRLSFVPTALSLSSSVWKSKQ